MPVPLIWLLRGHQRISRQGKSATLPSEILIAAGGFLISPKAKINACKPHLNHAIISPYTQAASTLRTGILKPVHFLYIYSMKNFLICCFILCCTTLLALSQETPYIKKEFLIIHSGKDYAAALKKATDASRKLKLKLDLRGLVPHPQIGLTCSEKVCEDGFGFYPCYVARGRGDDGAWVSIEYSDAYIEFERGYYIVVVCSFVSNNEKSKTQLLKTKAIYPDAYLKASKVYVGCIH